MNVNPTRMELTNLKRKLTTARRGHKLLKDKRDELMRRFLDMVRENKELRREVESAILQANKHISVARSVMSGRALDVALMMPKQELSLDVTNRNVMSVNIPVFDIKMKSSNENDAYSYGLHLLRVTLMKRPKIFPTFSKRWFVLLRLKRAVR